MKLSVYIASSLDGYIARKNGDLDWLLEIENESGDDFGYSEFISDIDCIVMGRGTFEKVSSFDTWPYEKPVTVLSGSMSEPPAGFENKISILSGEPGSILESLKDKGYEHLYIDGGKTIQNFLQAGLIDEITISSIPVLIGSGIPLFHPMQKDIHFTVQSSTMFPNGVVQTKYKLSKD